MSYFLLIISAILASFGQIFLKKGALHSTILNQNVFQYFLALLLDIYTWGGVISYGLSFAIYMIALKKVDLSVARSFSTLSYVLVIVFSVIIFKDSVTLLKVLGMIFICVGVFLLTFSVK
ncbi:MAG: hypothetical protein A2086_01420 [Spirochaetes bacterium GWD1_27_9]|nr:MAG: hypothetical protein A2Z98_01850 [Spirochaetes bacterium GWB1_27_13]OHD24418.1 MAG: hypothetical protein A2Y34_04205 [Spirochaetes bacterium GWC1_27_15]OHD36935.1 MAG: hypothetical protein A2086_01420 [Spirochaetes bacterium GWD1_27_9]